MNDYLIVLLPIFATIPSFDPFSMELFGFILKKEVQKIAIIFCTTKAFCAQALCETDI